MKREIETLISDISSNLDDTTRGTDVFQLKLQKSFGKLSNVESGEMSLEETMAVLREVVKSSKEIAKNIDVFSLQLKKADSEINRLKQKIADIQKDANTDGLTNLLNRRAFDLELAHLIMIERPFSVIMGDIDRFKSLNDNYGHLMGDMALKAVAGIFLNSNRDGSSSYRYGGEEFVMLLPDTKMVVARQIAESMRRKVEKLSILSKETGTKINNVTSSFGVAEYQKGDDESELIERVDKLLYEAKRLGRNRVMPLSM
jgi:diguanylate cyclase